MMITIVSVNLNISKLDLIIWFSRSTMHDPLLPLPDRLKVKDLALLKISKKQTMKQYMTQM